MNAWSTFVEKTPQASDGDFEVMFSDGRIANALVHETWQRTVLKVQDEKGLYWTAILDFPVSWRKK